MTAVTACISQADVASLRTFHEKHFPCQRVPNITPTEAAQDPVDSTDLGFYEDGTPRILTDEQIAMFRHSEIQQILAERRRKKAKEEEDSERRERAQSRVQRKNKHNVNGRAGRYDNDAQVHARQGPQELSYDNDIAEAKQSAEQSPQPKTFQWPVLGTG